MVYCGKPSKGCGQCRSRKIKCDQGRPACSQCQKAHRVCSGYRDELSLMFRDESEQVVQKASSRKSPQPRRSRGKSGTPTTRTASPKTDDGLSVKGEILNFNDFNINPQQQQRQQQLVRLPNPGPLVIQPSSCTSELEAACFFARWTTFPGALWAMNTIPDLFMSEGTSSEKAMKASVVSAGTAMVSRIRNSQSLKHTAERQYGHALQLMSAALSDEKEVKANSTLSAVIILAMFEVRIQPFLRTLLMKLRSSPADSRRVSRIGPTTSGARLHCLS